jgi:hypothetical protein
VSDDGLSRWYVGSSRSATEQHNCRKNNRENQLKAIAPFSQYPQPPVPLHYAAPHILRVGSIHTRLWGKEWACLALPKRANDISPRNYA